MTRPRHAGDVLRLSATAAVLVLTLTVPTRAGHESPFDPSYYPHEIRIESMTPAAAGGPLGRAAIHAFVGGNPYEGRQPPADVTSIDSLDAYVVLTVNAGRLKDGAARCAAAQRAAGMLTAKHGGFVFAPYPVTPYHEDYLAHADLAAAARKGTSAPAGTPGTGGLVVIADGSAAAALLGASAWRGATADWDVRVETVTLRDLLAAHATRFAGWIGPPWLKEGWFDAYLLMAGSVGDHTARADIDRVYGQLISGEPRSEAQSVNLERRLVSLLRRGCERVVAGYTTRREYYSSAYSPGIENVGFDSYDGFDSGIFVRTAKLKDFPWNGVLRLGLAAPPPGGGRPPAAWNPVAGFGDPLGRLVWAAVGDPAMLPAPYGGGWIANRIGSWETWSVKVQRAFGGVAVPDASRHQVDVPADAVLPHRGSGALDRVGPGKRAADMVEYRVLASLFHDGTSMTAADVLYPFAFAYRWGVGPGGDRGAYDPAVGRDTVLVRRFLAGVKITGVQKVVRDLGGDLKLRYDVPIVRVYLGYAGADQYTPLVAMPWSTVPWHVLALMDEAARRGVGTLSPEAAARLRVPVLDLVRSPTQRERLARIVDEFAAQGYVPEALRGMVTAGDARKRWRALAAFYREHHHFLVTNGPYRLQSWSQTGVVLGVFRDLSYPLGVGSFDKEVYPRRAFIRTIAVRGGRIEFRPDVERVFKYDRYYKMVTEALGSNTSGAYDDINAVCRYLVVRGDGQVVKAGTVAGPKSGGFSFNPADGLSRGDYTIVLAVFLNDNFINPDVKTVVYRK
ncbi:MAG TPA: hypothetical protein VGZ23_14360 [bacterium]|nr:hypothetical protein [bacterium]